MSELYDLIHKYAGEGILETVGKAAGTEFADLWLRHQGALYRMTSEDQEDWASIWGEIMIAAKEVLDD